MVVRGRKAVQSEARPADNDMNRRDLLKGFLAATVTVAISLRLAKGMPPIDLKNAIDTFRWELATDNYYYGIDLAKPWHVEIYKKLCGDDWELMEAQDLMAMAEDGIVVENQEVMVRDDDTHVVTHDAWPKWKDPDTHTEVFEEYSLDPSCEEMEAAATIAMSQGFAALQVEGGPHIINGDYNFARVDMENIGVCRVPTIYDTREALFRHG